MTRYGVAALILIAAFISCNVHENRKTGAALEAKNTAKINEETAQKSGRESLASKHNAFIVSPEALSELSYTIDFQRALLSRNDEPILVTAELVDMFESDGKCVLRFVSESRHADSVFFELETTVSRENLPKGDKWDRPRFDVVALIRSVARPQLEAYARSDDEGYAAIYFDSSEIITARGVCLEFVRLKTSSSF